MASSLMAFSLLTCVAIGPAFGQTGQAVRTEVPYEFMVGSKTLPAGTYSLSVSGSLVQVQPSTGAAVSVRIVTRLGGPSEFLQDGALVFDKTGAQRILSEVWMPGTDGILVHSTPDEHHHEILMFSGGSPNTNLSGPAAYDRTCRRCHGPDGKGDPRADKFFKTTIPRLNSAAVQGKSDAELKRIISQGSSAMPPVEIEEAGFRHRLPAQSVDAVVAYVRTLKR
jgi:cytochrome c5